MYTINTFLFIKDYSIEQKTKECLQRFNSINISDFANDNITFIERFTYKSYQLLIIDLTQDLKECLELLETMHKPSLILGIITHPNQSYNLLNKGIFDVITNDFTPEMLTNKIGKIRKTIDSFNQLSNDFYAAENEDIYTLNNAHNQFCFLKYKHISIRVKYNDIAIINSNQRFLEITLKNGKTYRHYSSLKKFYESLPKQIFAKVNNKTIVNVSDIEKVERNQIYILNNTVEITRIYLQKLKTMLAIKT